MAGIAILGTGAGAVDLSNALSQEFENDIVRQINREAATLRFLPKMVGYGKNCAWDAEVGGALAATYSEEADVGAGEFGVDDTLPATLNWGLYRSPFRITGIANAASASSSSPAGLRNLLAEKMFGAISKLGDVVNKGVWSGTGANAIVGLLATNGGLDDAGTYANINRATYADWQGNVRTGAVQGTPEALTFDRMRQVVRDIFVVSGMAPDLIVTEPAVFDKFAGLFDANRRWPASVISTAAGEVTLRGGEQALEFDGIPVIRDKDHPANKMSFLNTNHIRVAFLPTFPGQDNAGPNQTFVIHDDQKRISGLPARIEMLGKTGDTTKAFIKVYVQTKVTRPNACGVLEDITNV